MTTVLTEINAAAIKDTPPEKRIPMMSHDQWGTF
jgi:hypothetical protein